MQGQYSSGFGEVNAVDILHVQQKFQPMLSMVCSQILITDKQFLALALLCKQILARFW